jgi:peptidoglycan/xylan/chitin deacetylase (PgdA/CDA1 family)
MAEQYGYGHDIVNTLQSHGAKGSFFVNGNNWVRSYVLYGE